MDALFQFEIGEVSAVPDRACFAALVERQSRFAFQVAYSILRNSHDAEDAVQDAFLKIYRAGGVERIQEERAYIARVAWRAAADRLAKRRSIELPEDLPSRASSPEKQAIDADRHAMVHRLIDALPEELRQPLALSTVDELTSREVGEVMGIPEATVRTRLFRAREILKQKLAQRKEPRHGS